MPGETIRLHVGLCCMMCALFHIGLQFRQGWTRCWSSDINARSSELLGYCICRWAGKLSWSWACWWSLVSFAPHPHSPKKHQKNITLCVENYLMWFGSIARIACVELLVYMLFQLYRFIHVCFLYGITLPWIFLDCFPVSRFGTDVMEIVATWTKSLCFDISKGQLPNHVDGSKSELVEDADKFLSSWSVLDIGTGNGLLLQELAKQGYAYIYELEVLKCWIA